jgi:hypothetical protein
MGITIDGITGEQKLFALLKERGYEFFQPDAIGLKDNQFYVFEVKCQKRFKAPPFDGHGLPRWQVQRRLDFEKRTGIKSVLVVFDKETNEVFYQSIKKLDEGEHFDTFGKNPRRIYKLDNFNKLV